METVNIWIIEVDIDSKNLGDIVSYYITEINEACMENIVISSSNERFINKAIIGYAETKEKAKEKMLLLRQKLARHANQELTGIENPQEFYI